MYQPTNHIGFLPMNTMSYWHVIAWHQHQHSVYILERDKMADIFKVIYCTTISVFWFKFPRLKCIREGPADDKPTLAQIIAWRQHYDVIKWEHFPRYWPFVRGIHRSQVNSPLKASDAELWCLLWSTLINQLSKQSWGWWFETPSFSLWRHCNGRSSLLTHKSNASFGINEWTEVRDLHPC